MFSNLIIRLIPYIYSPSLRTRESGILTPRGLLSFRFPALMYLPYLFWSSTYVSQNLSPLCLFKKLLFLYLHSPPHKLTLLCATVNIATCLSSWNAMREHSYDMSIIGCTKVIPTMKSTTLSFAHSLSLWLIKLVRRRPSEWTESSLRIRQMNHLFPSPARHAANWWPFDTCSFTRWELVSLHLALLPLSAQWYLVSAVPLFVITSIHGCAFLYALFYCFFVFVEGNPIFLSDLPPCIYVCVYALVNQLPFICTSKSSCVLLRHKVEAQNRTREKSQ